MLQRQSNFSQKCDKITVFHLTSFMDGALDKEGLYDSLHPPNFVTLKGVDGRL